MLNYQRLQIDEGVVELMYLYLLKFNKYPTLTKVGISRSIDTRIKVLKPVHGDYSIVKIYHIGKHTAKVERLLHSILEPYNIKVSGEGGSEFFELTDYIVIESLVNLCGDFDVSNDITITKRRSRNRVTKPAEPIKHSFIPIIDLNYIEQYFYEISKLTVALSFSNMLYSEIT